MRLNLVFMLLLVTASTSVAVIAQSFEGMRSGDIAAALAVATSAAVTLAAGVLLGRIILRVSVIRRAERES